MKKQEQLKSKGPFITKENWDMMEQGNSIYDLQFLQHGVKCDVK